MPSDSVEAKHLDNPLVRPIIESHLKIWKIEITCYFKDLKVNLEDVTQAVE
jgi:hypothetical protein